MESSKWYKQSTNKPLFEDLLWSRPENRTHAGKLLIIGGNSHAIGAPGQTYAAAMHAGIGSIRVLLPDSTKKVVGKIFPEAEFAASTPSGSFGQQALAQMLESASWADGVLLAGDFGRNSEIAILLESFANKYHGQLSVAQDSLDYFLGKNSQFFSRKNTVAVINISKLQKLAVNNKPNPPVQFSMNLHQLVEILQKWTSESSISVITNHSEQLIAASDGKISTTPYSTEASAWQTELAAYAAVWLMQQPSKPFEALTTAVFEYSNA
jgi:NAD(P)H-hydrate repair Nnr-like enzyme with NAD(P)H-hydrate dehydratase domain